MAGNYNFVIEIKLNNNSRYQNSCLANKEELLECHN